MKILNDNFEVKVSEKTTNRVLQAHDIEWIILISRPRFYERIKKSRIKFGKYLQSSTKIIVLIYKKKCH